MFVALTPPPEAVAHLDAFLEPRREAAGFRWAAPEQYHVTLAFLASVEERRLDELAERLGRAAARRTAFRTALRGGGAFPNAGRAKVLWAGLDLDEHGGTELDRLATGCRAAANRAGIPVEGQRFRPHVTVARIGRPTEVTRWVRLLDGYAGPAWIADRVELVASYLGEGPRGRPRYESVEQFTLGVA
jgi:2'-5' RNA ligase